MKSFAAVAAFAGVVAAQAALPSVAPGNTPAGCSQNYQGSFEITVVKPSGTKRDLIEKRQATNCGQTGILTITGINNGVMLDNLGRTAYIASENGQFQFDKPVQAGGEYSVGWAVCSNQSLALGGTTLFRQCDSGGIFNLYLTNTAAQCEDVNINIIPCAGSSAGVTSTPAAPSTSAAAPPAPATTKPSTPAGNATSAVAVSVKTDGQPQATAKPTQVPVSVYTDGQPQATAKPTSIVPAGAAANGVGAGLFGGALLAALAML